MLHVFSRKLWQSGLSITTLVVLASMSVYGQSLGDVARDLLPRLAARAREVEGDVRRLELVEVLLRVLDVGAAQDRVVVEDVPLVGLLLAVVGLLGAQDDRALVDVLDLELVERRDAEVAVGGLLQRRLAVGLQRGERVLGPADDLLGLLGVVPEVGLAHLVGQPVAEGFLGGDVKDCPASGSGGWSPLRSGGAGRRSSVVTSSGATAGRAPRAGRGLAPP